MNDRLPITQCQRRLALIWILGSGLLFLLLIAQSLLQIYGGQNAKVWGWFLPTVLPTLTLIVSAVAYSAKQGATTDTVDIFAYRLSQALSAFYLLMVAIVPLGKPFTGAPPIDLMTTSSLWLAPLQGLVGIAMGIFFGSRQSEKAAVPSATH